MEISESLKSYTFARVPLAAKKQNFEVRYFRNHKIFLKNSFLNVNPFKIYIKCESIKQIQEVCVCVCVVFNCLSFDEI